MNKKINRIIGLIELGLLPFLTNYVPPLTLQLAEPSPSVLERIVESQDTEIQRDLNSSNVYSFTSAKSYSEGPYRQNLIEYIQKHIADDFVNCREKGKKIARDT